MTKAYDDTANAPSDFTQSYSVSGLLSGDASATLSDTNAACNSAHVKTANKLTGSGLAITRQNMSQAGDYQPKRTSASASATITPMTIGASLAAEPIKNANGDHVAGFAVRFEWFSVRSKRDRGHRRGTVRTGSTCLR